MNNQGATGSAAPRATAGDPPWQIWVDTGGTFTDCLAVDGRGELHHTKVLSTSALRGRVAERRGDRRLRLEEAWPLARDFLCGFCFRLLGGADQDAADDWRSAAGGDRGAAGCAQHPTGSGQDRDGSGPRVVAYDSAAAILEFDAPLDEAVTAGVAFELLSPEEAPVLAARWVTGTPSGSPLPPLSMRLATTWGTNALLERRGAEVALFITKGFGDLLRIGTQQRPDLFALDVRKPEPLCAAVVEVPERLATDGSVIAPLEGSALLAQIAGLRDAGIRSAAIALMHGYRNPEHEHALTELLKQHGFTHVSCSSDLAPFIKILPRAETTVADAYLAPVIGGYLERVAGGLGRASLHVMTSAGGLVAAEAFRAKDSLLSGPAGGVVGAAAAAARCGEERVIAFDMGGTSTDVARYDAEFEYVFEHEVGDAHLVAPALAIETVAAGGGSICWVDGPRLRVGPQSAGARPGPACYAAGGPLCLTDVNLLLGRLAPHRFAIPIDPAPAAAALDALRNELGAPGVADSEDAKGPRDAESPSAEALLEGFLEIADERMADAIRRVSIRRGYDPRDYVLVAFGGAGPQHACGVAEQLGMRRVLVPPDAGVLSALGIGRAQIERFAERQVLQPLGEIEPQLAGWIAELEAASISAVASEGVPRGEITVRRRILNARLLGQETSVSIEYEPEVPVRERFRQRYREIYGYDPENQPLEVESIRVASARRPDPVPGRLAEQDPHVPLPQGRERARFDGQWHEVPHYDRARLRPGARLRGPALIFERHCATVLETGWSLTVEGGGALVLERIAKAETPEPNGALSAGRDVAVQPEAVRLELFIHRFGNIAAEMGEMLRRTALSTNVKERLDFSCGLLDPDGELVVNAPHIPVHLGALGTCVRSLRAALPMGPGDVVVTNHPAFGGSHLPDVTLVTPVHDPGGELLGYVASRAHHAEIGGSTPGSMPPRARQLAEEGVVIPPQHLIRGGKPRWQEIRRNLLSGPHPTRAVRENLADLAAAVAANRRGAARLARLAQAHGAATLRHYMEELKAHAEQRMRAALQRFPDGRYDAEEFLDDGAPLKVRITVAGDHATLDFSGSADTHVGNLNATPTVVDSVVIYVMRLLLGEPLPLNDGLRRALEIRLPRGLLCPEFPDDPACAPAVMGGNVETSQRLVDLLLKALGLAACSQGTMNNIAFGGPHISYYETICGGCGAGPDFEGASAVHSHMTNTRITDPEILEHRYPVRLERFAIRPGSGGRGLHRGGDGVVREITFLAPLTLSILSQHRRQRPYGLAGGEPGAAGDQYLVRRSGEKVTLEGIDGCDVDAGDRLCLETPGGGGYGLPADAEPDTDSDAGPDEVPESSP